MLRKTNITCKNHYKTNDVNLRKQNFNDIWIKLINDKEKIKASGCLQLRKNNI